MAEPMARENLDAAAATLPAAPSRSARPWSALPSSAAWRRVAVLALALLGGGCAGRHRGPRSLAALGAVLVGGGGATWIGGERSDQRGTATAGAAILAIGLAAVVASGGWMASDIACSADPDCDESEQCREVPAPPGGIPYKQCVRR
jgi:hypothetical protein